MKMSKLLLYSCKAKPYLLNQNIYEFYESKYITSTHKFHEKQDYLLNGKIVAECDFEVEKIFRDFIDGKDYTINPNGVWVQSYYFKTKTLYESELYNKCCLTFEQMYKYFDDKDDKLVGYAIHIKNLHIFDEPRELNDYCFDKAPTRLMKFGLGVIDVLFNWFYILPVNSQELVRVLNGEQTILVRKKVLKEMLLDE